MPDTVTHPSTNRAQCKLTSLIETNALPLRQTTTCGVVLPFNPRQTTANRIHRHVFAPPLGPFATLGSPPQVRTGVCHSVSTTVGIDTCLDKPPLQNEDIML